MKFTEIKFPEPVLAYAVEPKSRADEDKISTAMQRLREEDPTIGYTRDPQTHELLLAGQGPAAHRGHGGQAEAAVRRGGEPETAADCVPGDHHGRDGGARPAQEADRRPRPFGDCKIRVEPLPRGSDFQFENDIFGGSIPRQYVPAIEKGIQDARQRGFLAGYPMVDFKATVFDGSFHAVDSNELSFKMAGSLAFKDAMSPRAAHDSRAGDACRGVRPE